MSAVADDGYERHVRVVADALAAAPVRVGQHGELLAVVRALAPSVVALEDSRGDWTADVTDALVERLVGRATPVPVPGRSGLPGFTCPACEWVFETTEVRDRHMRLRHGPA